MKEYSYETNDIDCNKYDIFEVGGNIIAKSVAFDIVEKICNLLNSEKIKTINEDVAIPLMKYEYIVLFDNGRYEFRDDSLTEIIEGLEYSEGYRLYYSKLICNNTGSGMPDDLILYDNLGNKYK